MVSPSALHCDQSWQLNFSSDAPLLIPNCSFPRGPPTRKNLWILGSNQSHWGQLHGQLSAGRAKPQEWESPWMVWAANESSRDSTHLRHTLVPPLHVPGHPTANRARREQKCQLSHCFSPSSVTMQDGSPSVSVLRTNILGWSQRPFSFLHKVLQKNLNKLFGHPSIKRG